MERRLENGETRLRVWTSRSDVHGLRQVLGEMDAGLPFSAEAFAARLMPWIDDDRWYRSMLFEAVTAMEADPLASLPWRMQPGRLVQGIALVEAGGGSAMLALIAAEELAGRSDDGQRLLFDCGYSLIAVVAGALKVERWRLDRTTQRIACVGEQHVAVGDWLVCNNRIEQILIRSAERDVVVLTLSVRGPCAGQVALECDTGSGLVIRHGMADPLASRMLPLLALLPDAEAGERRALLANLSRDGEPMLRWQAMRHWLAVDPAGALPRLRAMAGDDDDPAVRRVAGQSLTLVMRLQAERGYAG